ncbi:MAG: DUF1573 domain-containing protein [Bacteroidota bacterium]
MKKTFLFLAATICFTLANAQTDKDKSADPNAPEITFETETHDYGTIDFGADGTYAFKFTNTGKDPLVITDAKGSCGCTVPKWPKEPVLKGQSNNINVSYDTKRVGPFTKTVTVTSNAKTTTRVLTIKGVVKSQEQTEDQTPVMKSNGMAPFENQGK